MSNLGVGLLLFVSTLIGGAQVESRPDLTQVDYPLLIGDWYLVNSSTEKDEKDYEAIRLSLNSDYSFLVKIKRNDEIVEYWDGRYSADKNTLILGVGTQERQVYHYMNTHNRLLLDGVTFFKMLSTSVSGVWLSHDLKGKEDASSDINELLLILQPDFEFVFRAKNADGQEVVHRGIYYTEADHLVLMYENGEHDSRFVLKDKNTLTLDLENGALFAVMNRVN